MSRCMHVGIALAIHVAIGMTVPAAATEPGAAPRVDAPVVRSGSGGVATAQSGFAPSLPLKRDTDSDTVGGRSAALAAACILLIAVWAAVQYRRRQRDVPGIGRAPALPWLGLLLPDSQARELRVVETAALAPHARLHVVAWRGREYLVSTAPGHVRVLDRREMRTERAHDQAAEPR